ncbi:MFS transporter [Leucobacter massiliensis]|uniref:Major facilitator superfamily (MFS) profile domain-containing protein n=1 Tax=Leucobacter massiliensis TaxID=1686285 RepID=A0A2S9QRH2_9MICO|nr:MFS transporter [Leucobacter massiliensis]PRI12197.1 hypothetical protein B4915_03860 [Leucobacter massiliensis]
MLLTRTAHAPPSPLALTASGIALIAASYGFARFAYGLFMPAFQDEFALDAGAGGAIAAGSYLSYCLAVLAAGALTRSWGSRAVAVAAGVTAACATLTVALAPHPLVLAVGAVVGGASTGIASPPLAEAAARAVNPDRRDSVQTAINSGTGLGVALAGPIAVALADHWRLAWALFSAVCVLVTWWVARTLPPRDADAAPAVDVADSLVDAGRPEQPAATSPARRAAPEEAVAGRLRLLLAAGAAGIASAAVWTFGLTLLTEEGRIEESLAQTSWLVLGVCGVIGAGAGLLVRIAGLTRAWVAVCAALAIATGGMAARPGDPLTAFAASAVFGAAYIALTGLLLVWATRLTPERVARGVSLAFLALAVGQACGSSLWGLVGERLGLVPAFACAAGAAAAAALIRPARRRRGAQAAGE